MKPLIFAAALLVAGTGCRKRIECTAHGGDAWIEAESAHFKVQTNLDAEAATRQVEQLEALRSALFLVHGVDESASRKQGAIIVKTREELSEFTTSIGVAWQGTFVLVADDDEQRARWKKGGWTFPSTLSHELAHTVHGEVFLRAPRWFREGLATFEETLELNELRTTAVYGSANTERLSRIYSSGAKDLPELWGWDRQNDSGNHEDEYASSWLWTHFFFNRRKAELDAWMKRLRTQEDPRKSFEEIFGSDYKALRAQLDKYLEDRAYQMQMYELPPRPVRVTISPLSPARVHLMRTTVLLLTYDKRITAETIAQLRREQAIAIELDPRDLEVRINRAINLTDSEAQRDALEEIIAENPKEAAPFYFLSRHFRGGSERPRKLELLRKTVERAPDHADALNSLAWELVTHREELDQARAYAERAVKVSPWDGNIVDTLAATMAAAGQCKEASETELRALELLAEGDDSKRRAEFGKRAEDYKQDCANKVPKS